MAPKSLLLKQEDKMKIVTLLCVLFVGCDNNILTVNDLEHLQKSCKLADEHLPKLKHTQRVLGFGFDPDDLNAKERHYNALIKESIWWYTYTCNKS